MDIYKLISVTNNREYRTADILCEVNTILIVEAAESLINFIINSKRRSIITIIHQI